ncbi:MAG: PD-(D/E)XK nuclease family protein [Candidatus Liptonbacteria bacterium]
MVKVSRSKIDLFLECPRCFWLDVKHKIKRPPPAPYTINSAIDYLLKQEFDVYRKTGKPHPIMVKAGIDAIPYDSPHMDVWRHNFTGVQHHHRESDFTVFGAVDDVWINPAEELMVVDYKATGAKEHKIHEGYPVQMEIYQWLLRQNGYKVSPIGYFVFARVSKQDGFAGNLANGQKALNFDIFVEPLEGNSDWIPDALLKARQVYDSEELPEPSPECEYCAYRYNSARLAGEILKKKANGHSS